MRQLSPLSILVIAALASLTACDDPSTSTAPRGSTTQPSPPPVPGTPSDAVWLNFDGPRLLVVAGDSLRLSGQVRRGTAEAPDTLEWETSDASIGSIEAIEKNIVLLRTFRSGTVTISASTRSARPELSRQLVLQVFARSNSASPIVVDEFSIMQIYTGDGRAFYEPKLRLHDTSATGTARVVGLAIDIPQLGSSVFCLSDRIVGAAGWSAFNPPGDMNYGLFLVQRASSRVGSPTVRVSAVLSDGLAVSSNVTGTMELNTTQWRWYDGEDTGVRCQL